MTAAAAMVGAVFDTATVQLAASDRSWPDLVAALHRPRGPITPYDALAAARDLGPITDVVAPSKILAARLGWLDDPATAPVPMRDAVLAATQRLAAPSQRGNKPPPQPATTTRARLAAFPEPATPGQPPAEPPSATPEPGGPTLDLALGRAPGPGRSA